MTAVLLFLKALPWRKIGAAAVGAIILAVLAAPWILWRSAVKDVAVADAARNLAVSEMNDWKAAAERAIGNRTRLETALETIGDATTELSERTAELSGIARTAAVRATEVAAAREELADLRDLADDRRRLAENLNLCETNALVIRAIAEGN